MDLLVWVLIDRGTCMFTQRLNIDSTQTQQIQIPAFCFVTFASCLNRAYLNIRENNFYFISIFHNYKFIWNLKLSFLIFLSSII